MKCYIVKLQNVSFLWIFLQTQDSQYKFIKKEIIMKMTQNFFWLIQENLSNKEKSKSIPSSNETINLLKKKFFNTMDYI